MRQIDKEVVEMKRDTQEINAFIAQYEFFIIKTATKTTKHYVSKSDDEWSVALIAFSNAIKKYDFDKGSFFAFAELMIYRGIVDYYRSQGKHSFEITVDAIEDNAIVEHKDDNLKHEIEAITQTLESYGFEFMDLVQISPKSKKTRIACAKAVLYMIGEPLLTSEMAHSKLLPQKIIQKNTMVPQKILERHRKYIIAATEILLGDYPYLSEYLNWIRKEAE